MAWRRAFSLVPALRTPALLSARGSTECGQRWMSSKYLPPKEFTQKELEPMKLPGRLAEFTGNVLYPDENSALWDVDGEPIPLEKSDSDGREEPRKDQ